MKINIESVDTQIYIVARDGEIVLDVPDELVEEVEQTFSRFMVAQNKLWDIIEAARRPKPQAVPVETPTQRWCAECGDITPADRVACSFCGFPYPSSDRAQEAL